MDRERRFASVGRRARRGVVAVAVVLLAGRSCGGEQQAGSIRDARAYCPGTVTNPPAAVTTEALEVLFPGWSLPPVTVTDTDLPGRMVASYDGSQVVVERAYANRTTVLAHEMCHAVADQSGSEVPEGFPRVPRPSERPDIDTDARWNTELWAVTCSTAVTGERDWGSGNVVRWATREQLAWAAAFVAAGPAQQGVTTSGEGGEIGVAGKCDT